MNFLNNFQLYGNIDPTIDFLKTLENKKFLFSFIMSYSETSEIPGITFAGKDKNMIQFTPPADAEYLHYGYCKTIKDIPVTPDGIPTPGILTKVALESASIPHLTINAGSKIVPQLPFIETGLSPGKNISIEKAMTDSQVSHAVDYGRIVGRNLASMTDCLVIGESIPGGTTTALAVMKAFGFDAKVSSSMSTNPTELKEQITESALERIDSEHPYSIIATVGDPMIPFVAGMLSSASSVSKVILAGGTQMGAVLAFASKIDFNEENTVVGTTSYVLDDKSSNFADVIQKIANVPIVSVDPGLKNSQYSGLKTYSEGFAKEGVGAGGSIISSMIRTGNDSTKYFKLVEDEYGRVFNTD